MSRILLGVSGGIAAYKALEFVRLATGAGHAVRVVQTPASLRFVGAASFAALSGAPVLVGEFERDPARGAFPDQQPPPHEPISHLELVRNADLYLIAPASANTIAKLAGGLADNLLGSCRARRHLPARRRARDEQPHVRAPRHAGQPWRRCASAACTWSSPTSGRLASKGEEGVGRLAEPARLLSLRGGAGHTRRPTHSARPMARGKGLRVLVTAGGTREPIDSVRFIGNSSSGRMGLALAEAARARGARGDRDRGQRRAAASRGGGTGARSQRPRRCERRARRSSRDATSC